MNTKINYGLTLIEVLISISIMSLIASLGFISFTTMRDGIILKNQGYKLVEDLKLAQNKSIISKQGISHGAKINSDNYVLFGGSWDSPVYTETVNLPPGITMSATPSAPIVFNRWTGTTNDALIILSSSSDNQWTIVVKSSGIINFIN